MKKALFVIASLLLPLIAQADQYVIERLNGASIGYIGKRLTVGSTFEHKDSLRWDHATALYARNTRTGNVERIRQEDFSKRRNVSLWNYFVKINHGSSRICDDYCMCSVMDEVFVLQDTIRVRTDDPDIIDVCTGRLPASAMPRYYLTYRYNGYTYTASLPLDVDELIITRHTFADIPSPRRLLVAVFSIDRTGQKNVIADSMLIDLP